jgi:hypothetical protein
LWVLLLFSAMGSDTLVSVVAGAGALVYAASSLLAGRMLGRSPRSGRIGTVLIPLGVLAFGLGPGWLQIAAFILLVRGAGPFQDVPVGRIVYDTLDDLPGDWRAKYHHLAEREIALGGARVVSFLLMALAFAHGNDPGTARLVVVALAVCPLAVGLLQHRLERLRAGASPSPRAPATAACAATTG